MNVCSLIRRTALTAVAALLPLALLPAAPALATPGDPLGGPWGVHTGRFDQIYPTYARAHGKKKRLLAKVALRPHAPWFGNPNLDTIADQIHTFIHDTQHGDPNSLVQLTLFHQWPKGEKRRNIPLTHAEQVNYRRWVDTVVRTIGDTRTAVILEPDMALDAPGGHTADAGVRLGLVRYAAQRLSSLSRTTVYLEIGASDWLTVPTAARLLVQAGVGYTRGFALGATHHTAVGRDAVYAAAISRRLASLGYPGKYAVLDTSDNARPFTNGQGKRKYPHARKVQTFGTCHNKRERRCVTLGAPPTTNVTAYARKMHLNATQQADLRTYVDAFLWFGRPWRGKNGATFSAKRMLQIARTTPF